MISHFVLESLESSLIQASLQEKNGRDWKSHKLTESHHAIQSRASCYVYQAWENSIYIPTQALIMWLDYSSRHA